MRRPSFQFYPGDWQGNAKLRRCTHAEKGLWIDIMCLMHDAEGEYGVLRWPLRELAQAIGAKPSDLHGLIRKGVLKGADENEQCEPLIFTPTHAGKKGAPVTLIDAQPGPIWYSSRMVTDEYIRSRRGASTRLDGSPNSTPNGTPKVCFGEDIGTHIGDGPSSSSSINPPISPPSDEGVDSPQRSKILRRSKRAMELPMPAEWEPDDDAKEWTLRQLQEQGLDSRWAFDQLERMRDYARQHPSWRHADWNATWRNWVRKALERRRH